MHLPQLFCDPTRCKVPPLPLQPATSAAEAAGTPEQEAETARLATLAATHMAEKRERLQAMSELRSELRKRLNSTRRYYLGAAKTVGGPLRGFATSAREAMNLFVTVSEESTTALLADPDSAIMLIADMANNDGHAAHALSVMSLALLLGTKAELPEVVHQDAAHLLARPCCQTRQQGFDGPRNAETSVRVKLARLRRSGNGSRVAAPGSRQYNSSFA